MQCKTAKNKYEYTENLCTSKYFYSRTLLTENNYPSSVGNFKINMAIRTQIPIFNIF